MKIKKIRFNALDVFIILVVLAVIFTVAVKMGLDDKIVALTADDIIEYTVVISAVTKEEAKEIELDSKLYTDDGALIGTVVAKERRTAYEYKVLDTKEIKKVEIPERQDILLTLERKGLVNEKGCFLNGDIFVASGKKMSGKINNFSFEFEVKEAYKKH